MHPELEDLVIELMLQDKVKYFVDIKSFLIHIFKGEVYDDNTLKVGYHSEYLYPNLYGLYVTKRFKNGVYQVKFDSLEKIKTQGSTMFPKSMSPEKLVYGILENLVIEDFKIGKCKMIKIGNLGVYVYFSDNKIFKAEPMIE